MIRLERYLMSTYSVKVEGFQRLFMMVDKGDWVLQFSIINNLVNQNVVVLVINILFDELGEINLEVMEIEVVKLEVEEGKYLFVIKRGFKRFINIVEGVK